MPFDDTMIAVEQPDEVAWLVLGSVRNTAVVVAGLVLLRILEFGADALNPPIRAGKGEVERPRWARPRCGVCEGGWSE